MCNKINITHNLLVEYNHSIKLTGYSVEYDTILNFYPRMHSNTTLHFVFSAHVMDGSQNDFAAYEHLTK